MSVLVVGMSHRSAPVSVLEQVSMTDEACSATTRALLDRPSLTEAMIVSTCNRVEVYAVTSSFHTGVNDVVEVLHQESGLPTEVLRRHLYVHHADAAAEHMLVVASGLDSMVVGEQQIIGQVRSAYQQANSNNTVGRTLHALAQSALHTGKRVHSETDIDDAGASMVSFACAEAMRRMGLGGDNTLEGKTALVLGAGVMASLAATHLGKLGVDKLVVANRTRSRAEILAEHAREAGVPAEVVDFADRAAALARVDLVVSATGADSFTITADDVANVTHPVMLIDLSLPRDIDDTVTDQDGVSLVNIESLHQTQQRNPDEQQSQALAIVAEELEAYSSAQRVRDVVPAVAALRKMASELVDTELQRLGQRTPTMDESDREEVGRAVRRVVDKLLHQPTVRAKELAARSGTVSYDSALQELFGLEEQL